VTEKLASTHRVTFKDMTILSNNCTTGSQCMMLNKTYTLVLIMWGNNIQTPKYFEQLFVRAVILLMVRRAGVKVGSL